MFGFGPHIVEFAVHDLQSALTRGDVALMDVREPGEFAAERIEGAIPLPLSRFDPAELPTDGRKIVLMCGVGRRSATAAAQCAAAKIGIAGHLRGGLAAWKQAGLPTVSGT